MTSRRLVLTRSAAVIGAASTGLLLPQIVRAQSDKVRVGFMLPYTGTFAQLGVAIENGFRMALNEQGGKLGGREIEFFKVDDESNPAKGIENATRLVQRDNVDVLVGTVHSGVQMGIHKVARDTGVLNLIPNAGVHIATRAQCAPNVFRTSFTNSQPTLALGKAMVDRGHKKAVWITWSYAAGEEAYEGFEKSYTAAGGTIVKKLGLPFPNVEFQALLTEIASLNPDAVACFFAGGGAAKFLRDFAAAGLNKNIQLYGSGFLTEGVLDAAGDEGEDDPTDALTDQGKHGQPHDAADTRSDLRSVPLKQFLRLFLALVADLDEDLHIPDPDTALREVLELVGQDLDLDEPEETGDTFIANAELKALAAAFNVDVMALTVDAKTEAETMIRENNAKATAAMRLGFFIHLASYLFGMIVFAGISLTVGGDRYAMLTPTIWWTVGLAGHALALALVELTARYQQQVGAAD